MAYFHSSAVSNPAKIVLVSSQDDAALNLRKADDLKVQAQITTILQVVLESKVDISLSEKDWCLLDYQSRVQLRRKLDLLACEPHGYRPELGCPQHHHDRTPRFLLRKVQPDDAPTQRNDGPDPAASPTLDSAQRNDGPDPAASPTLDFVERKASPDSPSIPTYDYRLRRTHRDSPSRLSSVIEESESFVKPEASALTPPITDFFSRQNPEPTPASQNFAGSKSVVKPETVSHVPQKTQSIAAKLSDLGSLILCPLQKLRDAYVKCMMSIEGAGDFAGMVQGGHIASTGPYFAELPLSKTDAKNYG